MHSEDRYILSNMLSNVNITNDIYFACEEGFIKTSELYSIQSHGNYEDNLIALFFDWYENRANPEQQMLVDLNGFVHLNDQFDDLQAIMAVEIEKKFLSNETDKDKTVSELALLLDDNLGVLKYLPEGVEPIKTESDLSVNANMVYLLSCSDKRSWRKLVNNLLFRMKNNNYNGITAKESLDWLIHNRNVKAIEYKAQMESVYAQELEYEDSCCSKEDDKSFIEKALKIKKSKALGYAKKAIKRGLKTLEQYIDKEDVVLFNSGDGFVVEGGLFNYRFKKSHTSLIEHTLDPISYHIPYDLIVMNKDNLELANLCIYFDETPIIDQVISAVLYLQSGNEKELIESGNFFNRTDAFHTDPIMKQIKQVQREINLADYESLVGEVEIMVSNGISMNDYTEVFLDVDLKEKEEAESKRFDKIKEAVFKSLPNFIGADLPKFVYSDFKNLTFDGILDEYSRTNELSLELEENLRIC